jgi:hypothetical protein
MDPELGQRLGQRSLDIEPSLKAVLSAKERAEPGGSGG